ncbi:hypothetical protein E2562_039245 [Oryza meyeriana var. granulata]|uniref:Uncharacterized protein n=1 Tax=Oryza meyeriana var. granulata TaxID=110450 RepID=A0A6G1CXX9_9ORYZ|nr:hypothetical protein E2562_039245 [Oryza meyeriana var. granulata]
MASPPRREPSRRQTASGVPSPPGGASAPSQRPPGHRRGERSNYPGDEDMTAVSTGRDENGTPSNVCRTVTNVTGDQ